MEYGVEVISSRGESLTPSISSSSQRLPVCQSEMTGSRETRNTPVEICTGRVTLVHSGAMEVDEEKTRKTISRVPLIRKPPWRKLPW